MRTHRLGKHARLIEQVGHRLATGALALGLAAGSTAPLARAMQDEIGTECATCQFPTAVMLGLCSGVYVGHGMILTAAHCTNDIHEGVSRAYFGENRSNAAHEAVIDHCVRHPDGEFDDNVWGEESYDGVDLAYCILQDADEIPDLPVVPPMVPTGCERDWLAHMVYESGTPPVVTALGSGCSEFVGALEDCQDGVKRYVALQLMGQVHNQGSSSHLEVERWGEDATGLMSGDSGGPLLDVLPDGSWRLLGVSHGTTFDRGYFEAVPPYLHWIESDSGLDITPCHEFEDGEWNAHAGCEGELPLDPEIGGASWASACPSALGGGVPWAVGPFCGGFPWRPGGFASAPRPSLGDGLYVDADTFLAAARTVLDAPAARRKKVGSALAKDLTAVASFPFLARQADGRQLLAQLEKPAVLKKIVKRAPSRR